MMMISKTIMMAGAGLSVVDGLQVKSVVNQSTIAKPATEIVGTIKEGNPGNPDADTKVGEGSEYCFDNLPRHTAGSDVWSKLELDDGTIYCYLRIASNKKVKYLSKMMFDKLLKDNEDADFDDVFCAALNCRLENVDDGKEITNLSLDMKVRLCWTFGHVGTIKKGNPGSPDADTKVGEGSEYCFDNLPGCGRWRKLELADGKIYCYLRTASNKKVKYLSEQMFDKLLKDNKDANLDDVFCAALDCRLENEDGKEITKLTLNKKVQLFHALEGDEDDWDSDNSLVGGDGNWRQGDEDDHCKFHGDRDESSEEDFAVIGPEIEIIGPEIETELIPIRINATQATPEPVDDDEDEYGDLCHNCSERYDPRLEGFEEACDDVEGVVFGKETESLLIPIRASAMKAMSESDDDEEWFDPLYEMPVDEDYEGSVVVDQEEEDAAGSRVGRVQPADECQQSFNGGFEYSIGANPMDGCHPEKTFNEYDPETYQYALLPRVGYVNPREALNLKYSSMHQ